MSKYQLFVKESCGTCKLIEPLLPEILNQLDVELVSQDDADFPEGYAVTFDESLERSYRANIELVPTVSTSICQNSLVLPNFIGPSRNTRPIA